MPKGPDPVPSLGSPLKRRFWRIFQLLVLLSVAIAAIAVVLVARGDPAPLAHINMLIATALGVGLTVLVGTGLMTLVFISNSSGHDEAVAHSTQEEKDKE
jgi:peptidoglycan/LPS O-acetylase OafA/YrhL